MEILGFLAFLALISSTIQHDMIRFRILGLLAGVLLLIQFVYVDLIFNSVGQIILLIIGGIELKKDIDKKKRKF